jgi:integrase
VPAARMKARREHRVPLSPQVIELLDNLSREQNNPFLFIGSKPGAGLSETSLAAALRRAGRMETVHGLRSSFSDFCHERTSFSNHEIELSLAHAPGAAQERAYRRGDMLDRRRRLMAAWAAYCCSPPAAGAVVPLRKKSAPA